MPRIAYAVLDLGTQHTASASAPKPSRAVSSRTLVVPHQESC